MVSRRSTLALLGVTFADVLGGCVGGQGQGSPTEPSLTTTATPRSTSDDPDTTPDPNTPPEDWPPSEWAPDWTHTVPVSHVLGLDVVDDRLLITASGGGGKNPKKTVIQSYDSGGRSVRWSREVPGGAVADSMLHGWQAGQSWGVTDAGDTLLSVTGDPNDGTWTELHAIDAKSGEGRWSLRRERFLAVRGIVAGTVYVLAREFPVTPTEHYDRTDTHTPEPLAAELLAVDLADGSVRWRRQFTGVGLRDVAADDGGVFVAEMNRLLGLDHDGTRQWTVKGDANGKAIFPGPEVVYHIAKPEWDQTIARGVGHDGTVRWRREFVAEEAVRHRDRLYVAGDQLGAVRPDGTMVWRSPEYAGQLIFSPASETVYVRTGVQSDAVGAVALDDGSRGWTFDPPVTNAWPEAATPGTVVVGAVGRTNEGAVEPLYRVDATNGQATARYLDENKIPTRAFGDHVFIGTVRYEEGGQLLALPL